MWKKIIALFRRSVSGTPAPAPRTREYYYQPNLPFE
jgi:hypothetical protein